jgi:hypothetical protein
LQEPWYEKLGRWEEALEAYDSKLVTFENGYNNHVAGNPQYLEAMLGRLRYASPPSPFPI